MMEIEAFTKKGSHKKCPLVVGAGDSPSESGNGFLEAGVDAYALAGGV
tara:strand:- start:414 stop:557 length:144 start_codon:yes stop_codon:yes gene_type:complete